MKTISIPLPQIEGVELKNATVDLKNGVVVAEYGEADLYFTVKKGDFLTCISDPSKVVIFGGEAGVFGGSRTFTILYDLPMYINGRTAHTGRRVKFPFSNFRYSTKEEKALMIKEMEKLGKRYNTETSKIESNNQIKNEIMETTKMKTKTGDFLTPNNSTEKVVLQIQRRVPFFVKDIDSIRHLFPWHPRRPEWLKEYLLLIKTRRGNKHYVVKGLSFVGNFSVKGFSKFKVIGWRELS